MTAKRISAIAMVLIMMIVAVIPAAADGFKLNQTEVDGIYDKNFPTESKYSTFKANAEAKYLVPGLGEGVVPQGLDVCRSRGIVLVSGYLKNSTLDFKNSVLMVIELGTGKYVGEYYITKADGTPYTGHAGGVAVTDKNIYISEGSALHRIPLSELDRAGNCGALNIAESISVPVRASFCNYSYGILWVGDFAYGTSYPTDEYRHMTNRDGKQYIGWSVGYYLDDSDSGFSADKWNGNLPYATPDIVLSIEDKIQGFTVTDKYFILSQSYGRTADSKIIFYKNVLTKQNHSSVKLNGKDVPLWYLDAGIDHASITTPPMSEGIAMHDGKILVLHESGAAAYRDGGGKYPLGYIWSLDPGFVKMTAGKIPDVETTAPGGGETPGTSDPVGNAPILPFAIITVSAIAVTATAVTIAVVRKKREN